VKVIAAGGDGDRPDAGPSPENIARFQREARIATELEHPGIVRVLDAGMDDGPDGRPRAWFVMELVEGDSLAVRIAEREFEWKEAVAIVRALADALAVAHDRGVLHRDIKPTNILMDAAGAPHLTDFGLAKDTRTDSKYTRTGQTLGTPAYMSPEQARGDLTQLTPATDTWALGCVLYELLANRPAFDGDTPAAIIGNVMTGAPPSLPGWPAGVRRLLAGCLQKNPVHRYRNAAALRDDCDQVLNGALPRHRLPRSRRALGIVALMVAAVAAIAAGTAAWQGGLFASAPPPPPAPPVDTVAQSVTAAWAMRHDEPYRALDAMRAACAARTGRHDWKLQLGLLAWMLQGPDAALQAWEDIPDTADEATRAAWLRGLVYYGRVAEQGRDEDKALATSALQQAAGGTGAPARWAAAALAMIDHRFDEALAGVGDDEGWEPSLIVALVNGFEGNPERDLTAALRAYDRVIEKGVALKWALTNRGTMYLQTGDTTSAMRDYQRALTLRPNDLGTLLNRGALYLHDGKLDLAAADAERVLAASPDWKQAYYLRANIRRAGGDLERAVEDMLKSVSFDYPQEERILEAVEMLVEMKQPDRALAILNHGLKLLPRSAALWYQRGIRAGRAKQYQAAVDSYDRALAIRPDFPEAWCNRGMVHKVMGRYPEARRDLDEAVRRAPKLYHARATRGSLLVRLREWKAAIADLEAATALRPQVWQNWRNLGNARRNAGDLEGALAAYRELSRLRPKDPEGHGAAADALMRLGRWGEARESVRTCLALIDAAHPMSKSTQQMLRKCEEQLAAGKK
jgi:tetratricopeptide (TPR) repeat protein